MKMRIIRVVGSDSSISEEYDSVEDATKDIVANTEEWEWQKNPNGSLSNVLTGATYYLMESKKALNLFNSVN